MPQELPSVLSVVYSVIPPIKKGTDSRLGFGFRLGNHADFQTIFEIGPQKNTKPLGMSIFEQNPSCADRYSFRIFVFKLQEKVIVMTVARANEWLIKSNTINQSKYVNVI